MRHPTTAIFAVVALVVMAACDNGTTGPTENIVPSTISMLKAPKPPVIFTYELPMVNAEDIGTCNNVWAQDNYTKVYTLTLISGNTYNLHQTYKDGHFVTTAGTNPYGGRADATPGACISGDNLNVLTAGIKGTFKANYDLTVTGTLSGTPCTPADCTSTTTILNTIFATGWEWTIPDDNGGSPWVGSATYKAKGHGTWFDTFAFYPANDTGDII